MTRWNKQKLKILVIFFVEPNIEQKQQLKWMEIDITTHDSLPGNDVDADSLSAANGDGAVDDVKFSFDFVISVILFCVMMNPAQMCLWMAKYVFQLRKLYYFIIYFQVK